MEFIAHPISLINMEDKTFVESEKDFYNIFLTQFEHTDQAELAWNIIAKPKSYPCVVVKACGKYIYVYYNDIRPYEEPGY